MRLFIHSLMHLNAAKVQSHVDFTTFLSSLQPSDEDIERANAEDEELW